MLLSVLTEQDTHLLSRALDLSLTEQERSAYQAKVFARIISQNLCKHSIKIMTDDVSKLLKTIIRYCPQMLFANTPVTHRTYLRVLWSIP